MANTDLTQDEILQKLTELLTNSENIVNDYFNVFFNPTPMYITMQQYDGNGVLQTYSVPNRAMYNKLAVEGTVNPEGSVTAPIGTLYVDTVSNIAYVKMIGSSNTGWVELLSVVALQAHNTNPDAHDGVLAKINGSTTNLFNVASPIVSSNAVNMQYVGSLSDLTTSSNTNIVSAINEVYAASQGLAAVAKTGSFTDLINVPYATQTVAEAGEDNTSLMTPLRTLECVQKNAGGALKINNLGTVTEVITLKSEYVNIADITAQISATLPTITDNTKETTCVLDFTTTNSAYPTISTTGTFKWSDKNQGKAPTAYSIINGVRNVLVFKTHDNGANWEAEYSSYGGVETAFVRPNLSANGTLGGSSFAVSSTNLAGSDTDIYMAFDGNTSTGCYHSSPSFSDIFYNPIPLNVTSLAIQGHPSETLRAGSVYGSNDGTMWTFITSYTNTSLNFNIDMSSNTNSYKYYKNSVSNSDTNGYTFGGVLEYGITATYIAT